MPGQSDTPLILDTHSWIWLLNGEGRLNGGGFVVAAEEASGAGRLYVCAISIVEVALLASAGSLRLVIPVTSWIEEALQTPGLQVIEIDAQLAAEGAMLPGAFPGDPADRLIVAGARLTGGRLATADPSLIRYGQEGYVSILPLGSADR